MGLKQFLGYMYYSTVSALYHWKCYTGKDYTFDRQAAELMRNAHSIEKGLCVREKDIRLGFGHAKQLAMLDGMKVLKSSKDEYHQEAVKMSFAALKSYTEFHNQRGFTDTVIEKIEQFLSENNDVYENCEHYGGIFEYTAIHPTVDPQAVEQLFTSRHSIRDFEDTPVNQDLIKKAVVMAQRCPSACNRQGFRVYNFFKNNDATMQEWMSGAGGFEGHIQNYLLVTGKLSAYRSSEHSQFVVSASIFAAYLSLALHAMGLGCCIIERRLEWNKSWNHIQKQYSIPHDEQSICVIGVGNLKNTTIVPVSHRLPNDQIYRVIS